MNELVKSMQDRQMEQAFDMIRKEVEALRARTEKAESKVENWNKDAEIEDLHNKIKELHNQMAKGFNPTAEQGKAIDEWEKKHSEKHHKRANAGIGAGTSDAKRHTTSRKMAINAASYVYAFSQTHLGTLGSVYCEVCRGRARNMCHDDEREFERICKELDAEYFIGEV